MSATAHPLQWPAGWPRTEHRTHSVFRTEFSKSRARLLNELRLLGARNVVISSNMPLRRDGLPYADASTEKLEDPGVAIYFTLKDRPLSMARDKYRTPGENLHSLVWAVNSIRAIERHGGQYMMERAFAGFSALPPPGRWRNVLELADVPAARITRDHVFEQYRKLARVRHPDNGGNHESMAELNAARDEALREFVS